MKLPRFVKSEQARRAALYTSLLLAGGIIGWFLAGSASSSLYRSVRDTDDGYRFIAPLLFVQVGEERSFPEYAPLKAALQRYAGDAEVDSISIYFRDLDTSQWVGVNPDERFSPASMLKVLTLIAALGETEENPAFLTTRIRLPAEDDAVEGQELYPPEHPVQAGGTYTVEELMEHLIVESDNRANAALVRAAGERVVAAYADLEIPTAREGAEEGYTAQEYSRIFRVLYNGTYLSRAFSERALALLSRAAFTNGLVAGVPEGTVVSHKFGVRSFMDSGRTARELHDCGIIYYPGRPYFLCVMTRGEDLGALEKVIAGASTAAWEEVSRLGSR